MDFATKDRKEREVSWSGRIGYGGERFGRRSLHPGIVCIARHLRQSFKGERIRVEYAEAVHRPVGEHLALMGENIQFIVHIFVYWRLITRMHTDAAEKEHRGSVSGRTSQLSHAGPLRPEKQTEAETWRWLQPDT